MEESEQCSYINGAAWRLGTKNLVFLTAWQMLIRVAIITVVFLLFSLKSNKAGSGCYDLHQYITYERSSFCWKCACKAAKTGRYIPFNSHFHQMQTVCLTITLPEPVWGYYMGDRGVISPNTASSLLLAWGNRRRKLKGARSTSFSLVSWL